MHRLLRTLAAIALLSASLNSAVAAEERATFNVTVSGIGAGTLTLAGREQGGTYSVQGRARSTGVVRGLFRFTVEVAANGRVRGNRYTPSGYTEVATGRDGTKRTRYRYRNGVPQITQDPPEDDREPFHAKPAGQRGTLDPLTGVWAMFRDRPRDLACALDFHSYNGRERARLRLRGMSAEGDLLACKGLYTREDGFSPEEMAERVKWPFTIYYRDTGALLKVEELRVPTTFGLMRFRRQ